MVPFFVRAIISAKPPKKAINISLISGSTLPISSLVSACKGKNLKNKKAVNKLNINIVPKLITDFLSVSISFVAMENPSPKIGPINGEISMAPITTAVESALRPTEHTKIEQTKIHAVAPLIEISAFIAEIVDSRSVS